ncbi:CvpA family protein [Rufibacter sp. LB8]|uniref:CvpA family protein n=1 Tax=Rufibacter sp. LB8 TaxID=2777781 RepID=UPI00178C340E|nr:CvpA family protein [Rufibacter sp. LB8]
MNYIDLLLAIIVLLSLYTGWQRGLLNGLLDLTRWLGSLLIAFWSYPMVASLLGRGFDWSPLYLLPISFFIVAVLASIVIQSLGNWVLAKIPQNVLAHKSNHALGLLPGLVSGVVSAGLVAILLMAFPLTGALKTQVQESKIAKRFARYGEKAEMALADVFGDAMRPTLNKLTVQPGSSEMVELPYKVTTATPRPDLETEMLALINQERTAEGLQPLQPDTALRRVARLHSQDMFAQGYFSHYNLQGQSPFDRIRQGRVPFRIAGENLALAPTLTIAHEGLMNSPGHRANILRRQFGRVGIGILGGGPHRLMITQNFRN